MVIPCFNESMRLDTGAFRAFALDHPAIHFLFVDDGSTDTTAMMLQDLCAEPIENFHCLLNPRNQGKGETIRGAMKAALGDPAGYPLVGFWDADLATPLAEIPEMLAILRKDRLQMVFGSRVRLLGREIRRNPWRHYLGRLFATCASLTLGLPVYDTQCGAKIFRATTTLQQVLGEPFLSRWIFDVELIARFVRSRGQEFCKESIFEFPLHVWQDVGGSKLRPVDFLISLTDLIRIRSRYFL